MAKAARWRDEKRNAQRFVLGQTKSQTVETARAQSRKAGLPAWCRGYAASSDKAKPFEAQADEKVSEPPGSRKLILAIDFGSRRNRRRRERRAKPKPTFSARKSLSDPASGRRASSVPRDPHAGESGVDRKVGPISVGAPESRQSSRQCLRRHGFLHRPRLVSEPRRTASVHG